MQKQTEAKKQNITKPKNIPPKDNWIKNISDIKGGDEDIAESKSKKHTVKVVEIKSGLLEVRRKKVIDLSILMLGGLILESCVSEFTLLLAWKVVKNTWYFKIICFYTR
jgi:hypothetical protein